MNMFLAATAALASIVASSSIALATPATIASVAVAPAQLTIAFTGIKTPTGAVLLSVYDSEAAFDGDGKPVRQAMVAVASANADTLISGLPAGRYAIKAFHDVDGDMKMAVNPFGMPTEPYAFSNDAVGKMGPAKWADAAFDIKAGANRHSIIIR